MAFRILTICTGNICRSPAAERLLRWHFRDDVAGDALLVSSAGTRPREGAPIEPSMARLLKAHGADASGFAARRLSEVMVREADLVLGLTREHRSAAVQLSPGALKRSFTLREFTRLTAAIDMADLKVATGSDTSVASRLGALVELAPLQRNSVGGGPDDVEDPYGQGEEVFVRAHAQIADEVGALARLVAGDS